MRCSYQGGTDTYHHFSYLLSSEEVDLPIFAHKKKRRSGLKYTQSISTFVVRALGFSWGMAQWNKMKFRGKGIRLQEVTLCHSQYPRFQRREVRILVIYIYLATNQVK